MSCRQPKIPRAFATGSLLILHCSIDSNILTPPSISAYRDAQDNVYVLYSDFLKVLPCPSHQTFLKLLLHSLLSEHYKTSRAPYSTHSIATLCGGGPPHRDRDLRPRERD
jgi:hypothetical protein